MSEPGGDPDQQQAATPATPGPSAGQLLRQAREAAGLHVATLAVALKVPVRKLEALEEDRFDLLPDAVFVRALASSVCRTLKVDSQPVLDRLPQVPQPRLSGRDDGINAPFRTAGEGPQQAFPTQVSKPVVLTVFALLLGAIVLIFLPKRVEEPAVAAAPAASAPVAVASAPVVVDPSVSVASAPVAAVPVAAAPASSGPAPAAANAPVLVASAPSLAASRPVAAASQPAVAASQPLAAASAAATPASGVVVFRASGESWVKVADAKGTTVFQKLLVAGESAGATGALPLTVTVGSVKATAVEVRGQPFDLAPHSRGDNVARFEIK